MRGRIRDAGINSCSYRTPPRPVRHVAYAAGQGGLHGVCDDAAGAPCPAPPCGRLTLDGVELEAHQQELRHDQAYGLAGFRAEHEHQAHDGQVHLAAHRHGGAGGRQQYGQDLVGAGGHRRAVGCRRAVGTGAAWVSRMLHCVKGAGGEDLVPR